MLKRTLAVGATIVVAILGSAGVAQASVGEAHTAPAALLAGPIDLDDTLPAIPEADLVSEAESHVTDAESAVAEAEAGLLSEAESHVADAESAVADAESHVTDAESAVAEAEAGLLSDAESHVTDAESAVTKAEADLLTTAESELSTVEGLVPAAPAPLPAEPATGLLGMFESFASLFG
jgi:hypothetical protein